MEPALTYSRLKEKLAQKYDYDERRIVGIILARYDIELVKKMINQNYEYWNRNSGKILDVFWPGYGNWICPDEQNETTQILEFKGNSTRVYFDLDAFIDFKQFLKSKIPYRDKLEIVFVNYYDGNIHLHENIRIDIEKNIDGDASTIREFMEFIINKCAQLHDVRELQKQIGIYNIKKKIKGIKVSEIINTAVGVTGLLK